MEQRKLNSHLLIQGICCLIIFLAAWAQYSNTLKHEYVWDDAIVITENDRVKAGLGGFTDLFNYYRSAEISDQYGYRPITLVTFAADISFFGVNPHPAHWMNVLYFALACIALFFTLKTLFPRFNLIFPLLVTLLFLFHPIHVEVVANIKSRDEILALLFSLLTLTLFLQFFRKKQWYHLVGTILCFVLAFLSKENAISILLVIPLAILMEKDRTWKQKLIFLSPILILMVGALIGTVVAGNSTLGTEATEGTGAYVEPYVLGNPLSAPHFYSHRAATAVLILGKYLKNFLVPYPLVYFYGYNQVPLATWATPMVYLSLISLLGLIGLAVWRFRKNPVLAFGIFWFFLTIAIYSNTLKILSDLMSDRFLFMPSVGLCIVVVAGLAWLFGIDFERQTATAKKGTGKQKKKAPKQGILGQLTGQLLAPFPSSKSKIFLAVIGVLCLASCIRTFDRNTVWKDNLTLYSSDMEHLEECARAHFYYASEQVRQLEKNPNDPNIRQEIVTHYNRSIEIHPESFYSYLQLGRMYSNWGQIDNAITIFKKAEAQFPQEAQPRFQLGQAYFFAGRLPEAQRTLKIATDLAPNLTEAHFFLALATFHGGDQASGIDFIDQTIADFPDATYLYNAQSDFRIIMGDTLGGINSLKTILKYDPNHGPAYKKLVSRYQEYGQQDSSQKYYNEAIFKGVWNQQLPP